MDKLFNFLLKKNNICLFSFILGVFIILISYIYTLNRAHIGVAFLLASVVYYILPESLNFDFKKHEIINSDFTFKILINLFVYLILVGIILLKENMYHRPILFFFISALIPLIIALQIVSYTKNKYVYFILSEIIILSVFLSGSVYFEFPSLYGIDPFYHAGLIEKIVKLGHIPSLYQGVYDQMPIMHLEGSTIQLLLGTNTKLSYFFLSLIEKFSIIFVFLITSSLVNSRTGLIAALIFGISDYVVMWGFWFTPMIMGFTYLLIILYIIIDKLYFHVLTYYTRLKWMVFMLALSFMLIYTHPIPTFSLILLIFSLYVIYKLNMDEHSVLYIKVFPFLLILSVATINSWMHIFYNPGESFFSRMVLSIYDALRIDVKIGDVSALTATTKFPQTEIVLSELGYSLLILSGITGLYILLIKKQFRYFYVFTWFWIFFSIIYLPSFMNIKVLLPKRFFIFMYVPLSIGASVFTSHIFNFNKKIIYVLYIIFFVVLSFFMITTPTLSNSDSPIYAKDLASRNGFFQSEVAAFKFVEENIKNPISVDSKYSLFRKFEFDPEKNQFIYYLDPSNKRTYILSRIIREKYGPMVIVVRKFNLEKGFRVFKYRSTPSIVQPGDEFFKYLKTRTTIYNNGDVKIYTGYVIK